MARKNRKKDCRQEVRVKGRHVFVYVCRSEQHSLKYSGKWFKKLRGFSFLTTQITNAGILKMKWETYMFANIWISVQGHMQTQSICKANWIVVIHRNINSSGNTSRVTSVNWQRKTEIVGSSVRSYCLLTLQLYWFSTCTYTLLISWLYTQEIKIKWMGRKWTRWKYMMEILQLRD